MLVPFPALTHSSFLFRIQIESYTPMIVHEALVRKTASVQHLCAQVITLVLSELHPFYDAFLDLWVDWKKLSLQYDICREAHNLCGVSRRMHLEIAASTETVPDRAPSASQVGDRYPPPAVGRGKGHPCLAIPPAIIPQIDSYVYPAVRSEPPSNVLHIASVWRAAAHVAVLRVVPADCQVREVPLRPEADPAGVVDLSRSHGACAAHQLIAADILAIEIAEGCPIGAQWLCPGFVDSRPGHDRLPWSQPYHK